MTICGWSQLKADASLAQRMVQVGPFPSRRRGPYTWPGSSNSKILGYFLGRHGSLMKMVPDISQVSQPFNATLAIRTSFFGNILEKNANAIYLIAQSDGCRIVLLWASNRSKDRMGIDERRQAHVFFPHKYFDT
jgi:hypothetical protein